MRATLVEAIAEAAAGGAAMLFTPEMTGLLDRDRARAATLAARRRRRSGARRGARGGGEARASGSISARSRCAATDGKLANRGFVIDASGAIRARYDKIHLFDVDLPTGESWRESAAYAPGERAVVVDDAGRRARPLDLLRSALSRPVSRAERCRRDRFSPSRPPSPCRPARRIGTCCCAPARSRPARSSSPRRRPACTRTAARPMAIRWSSIPGARCCSTWARRRARLCRDRSGARRRCARARPGDPAPPPDPAR